MQTKTTAFLCPVCYRREEVLVQSGLALPWSFAPPGGEEVYTTVEKHTRREERPTMWGTYTGEFPCPGAGQRVYLGRLPPGADRLGRI